MVVAAARCRRSGVPSGGNVKRDRATIAPVTCPIVSSGGVCLRLLETTVLQSSGSRNRAIPYGCCEVPHTRGKPGHRSRAVPGFVGGKASGQNAGRIDVRKVEIGCHL